MLPAALNRVEVVVKDIHRMANTLGTVSFALRRGVGSNPTPTPIRINKLLKLFGGVVEDAQSSVRQRVSSASLCD